MYPQHCRSFAELPVNAQSYVRKIEALLGIPGITYMSAVCKPRDVPLQSSGLASVRVATTSSRCFSTAHLPLWRDYSKPTPPTNDGLEELVAGSIKLLAQLLWCSCVTALCIDVAEHKMCRTACLHAVAPLTALWPVLDGYLSPCRLNFIIFVFSCFFLLIHVVIYSEPPTIS